MLLQHDSLRYIISFMTYQGCMVRTLNVFTLKSWSSIHRLSSVWSHEQHVVNIYVENKSNRIWWRKKPINLFCYYPCAFTSKYFVIKEEQTFWRTTNFGPRYEINKILYEWGLTSEMTWCIIYKRKYITRENRTEEINWQSAE